MPRRPAKPAPAPASGKRRVSKLAKELKLTPEEEAEIREAFGMFVDEERDGPGTGDVIATTDVRKAMLYVLFICLFKIRV